MMVIPPGTDGYEQYAEEDVADVGEDVVEVSQRTDGMGAPEVVEA